jgi:hypothetical protein
MPLGIRAKLFGGFGVVLLLLAAVGAIGWSNTARFSASFESLYDDRLVRVEQMSRVQAGLFELRLTALQYGTTDGAGRAKIKADDPKWLDEIDRNVTAYAATLLLEEEKVALREWQQRYPAYLESRRRMMALEDEGKSVEAAAMRAGEAGQKFRAALESVEGVVAIQERFGQQMNDEVMATAERSRTLLLGGILLALALGAGVAFAISRGVASGVKAAQTVLTSITENCAASLESGPGQTARNDLTVEVQTVTRSIERNGIDEIGQTAAPVAAGTNGRGR